MNSKLVEPSHALANAEVVEVLTYDGPPTALTVQRHQVCCSCVKHPEPFSCIHIVCHHCKILGTVSAWHSLSMRRKALACRCSTLLVL